MNRLKKIAIPFIIILFPVVFWLVITRGHNTFRELPILGPIEVNAAGDTLYHTIPPFHFTDQTGVEVSEKNVADKIYIANFFFASCKTVCPEMNEQVGRVQDAFKDVPDFEILTFTVDPDNDNVSALAAYGEKMHANPSRWHFLTGSKDSIYALAREGYLVPAAEGKTAGDFFHSQDLILIDKQNRIRGVFDGTEAAEVDTLIDEIKLLLVQSRQKVK